MHPISNHNEEKKYLLPPSAESKGHYSIPNGYFESLEQSILETVGQKPVTIKMNESSLWTKIKPVLYLAACFVSLMLLIRVVKYTEETTQSSPIAGIVSDEEYDSYYQDYSQALETSSAEEELLQMM